MTPFDYINSINNKSKKDLMKDTENDQLAESSYVPYVVNKTLSYFPETVMYANEMNRSGHLPKKLQYHYLLNIIRPGKRYAKWIKKDDSEDVEIVKQYYGFNDEKARQALTILTDQQLSTIKITLTRGVKDEFSRATG